MKKKQLLIFLNVADPNPKDLKLKKAELDQLYQKVCQDSVKTFKSDLKSSDIKIISVLDDARIIVEFALEETDNVYNFLRSLPIVNLIDSILP